MLTNTHTAEYTWRPCHPSHGLASIWVATLAQPGPAAASPIICPKQNSTVKRTPASSVVAKLVTTASSTILYWASWQILIGPLSKQTELSPCPPERFMARRILHGRLQSQDVSVWPTNGTSSISRWVEVGFI